MKCKFCQAEMPDDGIFCPYCGKSNAQQVQEAVEVIEEALEENGEAVILVETPEGGADEAVVEEVAASSQVRKMRLVAMISGCLAVLAVLGTVLYFGITGWGWDFSSTFAWLKPRENTLTGNASYTVSDKKAVSKREQAVATMGDVTLTNSRLQVYYWLEVYDFLEEYSYLLSYVGLDYSAPLEDQISVDKEKTWQQYFLESALDRWRSNQAFTLLARDNGYELDEMYRKHLEEMGTSMEETAKKQGYESADAMLQKEFGAGVKLQDYIDYMTEYYTSLLYFNELYEQLDPTDQEIGDYFEKNKESFAESSITKDSGLYYSIRHVLVAVEGGTKGEDGKLTYSDAEWKACEDKAQKLLEEWKSGVATEDSFAALAGEHSADDNTKNKGGLYENFAKGNMKQLFGEGFENWCVAEERKVGDYALLKTDYGYHLVYFVGTQDIWFVEAEKGLLSQLSSDIVQNALDKYPAEINYKKIVLGEVKLA